MSNDAVPEHSTRRVLRLVTTPAVVLAFVYLSAIVSLGFVPSSSGFHYAIATAALVSGMLCWILAVYIWSYRRGDGLFGFGVLCLLVPLGFLWGWAYIIACAANERRVTR